MSFNLLHSLLHLFKPRESNNYRPRALHPEALTIVVGVSALALLLVSVGARTIHPLGLILGYASDISSSQVVASTNQERQAVGLAPLVYNSVLAQAAQAKAADMFTNQYWSHTSPSGKDPWFFIEGAGYKYRVAGENLARDFSRTSEVVQAWMESPTHRANIVNRKYEEIGVAVVDGILNGVETTLVVQMFGTPSTGKPGLAQAPPARVVTQPSTDSQWLATDEGTPGETAQLPVAQQPSNVLVADRVVLSVETSKTEDITLFANYSPRQLAKAVFLSLILLLVVTLIYDLYAIGHHHNMRLVGKNLAHIIFLSAVAFVVILYKSGAII